MFRGLEFPSKIFLTTAADKFKDADEIKTEDVAKICGYDQVRTEWIMFYLKENAYILSKKDSKVGLKLPVKFVISDEGYRWIDRSEKVF